MKNKTTHIIIILILNLCSQTKAYFNSDTLIICEGESIQLFTVPDQHSYTWFPSEEVSDPNIYDPTTSPGMTTTYFVEIDPRLENLVYNGDFSDGNVGFTSDYVYTTVSTYSQGHYAIFTSPAQFNTSFGNCDDHSPTTDELMLVADGATIPNENVWCQTVVVYPGQTYNFSAWITNIHPTAPSLLQFSINGVLLGEELSVEQDLCEWKEFSETWFSENNTEAMICITNQNTISFGNDFAIDDISFSQDDSSFVDTFTVVVLENSVLTIDTSICANEFIFHEGTMIPADTQMIFTYPALNGCDSLIQYNVESIDTSYSEIRVDTLCPGDSIFYLGSLITRDTSICEVYTNLLGCDSSFCFVAYFLSEATIDIDAIEPNCAGENSGSILPKPFAGLGPYQYQWSTGSTTDMISNLSSEIYYLTVTDSKFCTAEKTIELLEPPQMNLVINLIEPTCHGGIDGQIILEVTGGIPIGLADYNFNLNDQASTNDNVFSELSTGDYNLSIEDAHKCLLDTSIVLPEPNPIVISLVRDTNLQLGCFLDIDAQIFADYEYEVQWVPTFYLDCPNCEAPRAFPIDDVVYELSVKDTWGCQANDSISIRLVKDYEVYIPNAFSPNSDGVNDFFEIYAGKDVDRILSFTVFDRWGSVVYEANDFSPNDAIGQWDGLHKNKSSTPGIFIYLTNIRFKDGVEKIFSGDLSLIK